MKIVRGAPLTRVLLWLGPFLLILPASGATFEEKGVGLASGATPTTNARKCWMFLHMNKSGGTTVRKILRGWRGISSVDRRLFAGRHFAHLLETGYREEPKALTVGGYVESLRSFDENGQCKWFTIFRHPVTRLVSAFFFCKYRSRTDQLCGSAHFDFDNGDLKAFAKHWGNYGLRQLVLGLVPANEATSYPEKRPELYSPGWYMVKEHFDYLQRGGIGNGTVGSSGQVDEAMSSFLIPACEILETQYAAVGIMEDMESTFRLFDSALHMPRMSWMSMFALQGSYNVNQMPQEREREKAEAVRSALEDEDNYFKDVLWLDLALYQHAVDVHKRQLKEHELMPLALDNAGAEP